MTQTNNPTANPIIDGSFREELREGKRLLFYQPSGRVAWGRFLPLLLVALVIAPLASYLLLLAEKDFYYFIFVPLLLGAPVMGIIYLLIVQGRCRHALIGAVAGCTLMMFFYLGYWQLSFLRFMGQATNVPQAIMLNEHLEKVSGRTDLLGYFIYRNRTATIDSSPGSSKKEHDDADEYFGYLFYGLEFLALAGFGLGIGGGMAGRVYLEDRNRWAKAKDFLLPIEMTAETCKLIAAGDWSSLAKIPRVAAFGRQDKVRLTLRFEIVADGVEAPVYVSLLGSSLGKLPPELASIGKKGTLKHEFFRQLYVSPKESQQIAEGFPELGMTKGSI